MEWEEKSTETTATAKIKKRKEKRGERMPSVRIVDRRERVNFETRGKWRWSCFREREREDWIHRPFDYLEHAREREDPLTQMPRGMNASDSVHFGSKSIIKIRK